MEEASLCGIERCAEYVIGQGDLAIDEFDVRICYSKQRNEDWGRRAEGVDAVPVAEREVCCPLPAMKNTMVTVPFPA